MDGGGALFANFIAALGEIISPLVISYPADVTLDYPGLTAFVRERLPHDRPFFLLGESFSGPVAIALAANAPAGLQGLILSCTFARNPVPSLRFARSLISVLPVSHHLAPLLFPFMLGVGAQVSLRRELSDALAAVAPAVVKVRMRAVLDVDYSSSLARVNVPVLYLQALNDRVVSKASLSHIRRIKPKAEVVTIDGPHLLLQAAPVESANAVRAFIAQHCRQDSPRATYSSAAGAT